MLRRDVELQQLAGNGAVEELVAPLRADAHAFAQIRVAGEHCGVPSVEPLLEQVAQGLVGRGQGFDVTQPFAVGWVGDE